jgi:hypothetical protein
MAITKEYNREYQKKWRLKNPDYNKNWEFEKYNKNEEHRNNKNLQKRKAKHHLKSEYKDNTNARRRQRYNTDEVYNKKRRNDAKDTRNKNWITTLIASTRNTAKRKNIEHDIDYQFVSGLFETQNKKCFWFGFEMKDFLKDMHPLQPSLDRIDNNKGYNKNNVVLCCLAANFGRSTNDIFSFIKCLNDFNFEINFNLNTESIKENIDVLQSRKKKNWISHLLCGARKTAREKNLEFNLTEEFMRELNEKQNGLCYWYGCKMEVSLKPRYGLQYSLDRIDSKNGYTKDNVVLCCLMANLGKNKVDPKIWEEFSEMVRAKSSRTV